MNKKRNRIVVSLLLGLGLVLSGLCCAVQIGVPEEIGQDTTATMEFTAKAGLDVSSSQRRMAQQQEERRLAYQREVLQQAMSKVKTNYDALHQKPGIFSVSSLGKEKSKQIDPWMGVVWFGCIFVATLFFMLLWVKMRPRMREANALQETLKDASGDAAEQILTSFGDNAKERNVDASSVTPKPAPHKKQIETHYSGISLGGSRSSVSRNNPKKQDKKP